MTPEESIEEIKDETFRTLRSSRRVWIIEERGGQFVVHEWMGGPDGVAPPHSYPTLRKAAARLLQVLGTGPVAPQTWPERVCIGTVDVASTATDDVGATYVASYKWPESTPEHRALRAAYIAGTEDCALAIKFNSGGDDKR